MTEHARKFLAANLLANAGEGQVESEADFFERIADVIAHKDKQIEPEADFDQMKRRFLRLLTEMRFFPSYGWLEFLGQRKAVKLIDLPQSWLGGKDVTRTSLVDSDCLRLLDSEEAWQADVPDTFLKALNHKSHWQIKYHDQPNASGEIPSTSLWEAMLQGMMKKGFPVLHFPGALRPEAKYLNPPGPMVRGSINLAAMVREKQGMAYFDWNLLVETIVQAVRMLDAMVEIAEDEMKDGYMESVRRIGIGMMGWAEALMKLGMPYESPEAMNLARRVGKFVQSAAREASVGLVTYRGAVPGASVQIRGFAESLRNLVRIYVLPEFELAFLAGVTPGIEPVPALAGKFKGYLPDEEPIIFHPLLMKYLESHGLATERVMDQLMDEGCLHDDLDLSEECMEIFATGILPSKIVEHQTAFQQYAEDVIAARILIPDNMDEAEIEKCFRMALRMRCRALWICPVSAMRGPYFKPGISSS